MFNRDKASCVQTNSVFQRAVLLVRTAALPDGRMLLRKPFSYQWTNVFTSLVNQKHSSSTTACSGNTGSKKPPFWVESIQRDGMVSKSKLVLHLLSRPLGCWGTPKLYEMSVPSKERSSYIEADGLSFVWIQRQRGSRGDWKPDEKETSVSVGKMRQGMSQIKPQVPKRRSQPA